MIKIEDKIEVGSERNFGFVFFVFFLLVGTFPLLQDNNVHYWALAISIIFLALALLAPKTLSLPNKLWFKFGQLLGTVTTPIIMMLIYFLTVVPIGIIARLAGKDLLRQKFEKEAKTYWLERKEAMGSMKNQF